MNVICIDNKPRQFSPSPHLLALIKEGCIYEVEEESVGFDLMGNKMASFILKGVNKRPQGYAADRFIPLSDIDETEILAERETELVTI